MLIRFLLLSLFVVVTACGGGSGSSSPAQTGTFITASYAPPALPVYQQPLCPAPGYIWAPGYWAYNPQFNDFYWVPGTWVLAPAPGLLWTPPYWAWNGSAFAFYEGWWGPQVGFYGGIAYGFGYPGSGFQGGYWQGGQFYYNQAVMNVEVTSVRNVYYSNVVNNVQVSRASYNGGEGGIVARATAEEESAARQKRFAPTVEQTQHVNSARADLRLRASANNGKPAVAATSRAGVLRGKDVVRSDNEEEPAKTLRRH